MPGYWVAGEGDRVTRAGGFHLIDAIRVNLIGPPLYGAISSFLSPELRQLKIRVACTVQTASGEPRQGDHRCPLFTGLP